jgi:hypothetical protein
LLLKSVKKAGGWLPIQLGRCNLSPHHANKPTLAKNVIEIISKHAILELQREKNHEKETAGQG